jgi:hypothetical protein
LGHAVEIDQILFHQGGNAVRQQVVEELQVADAEIGEGVVIDGDAATDPAEAVVVGTQIVEGAGAADALDGGVQP